MWAKTREFIKTLPREQVDLLLANALAINLSRVERKPLSDDALLLAAQQADEEHTQPSK